MKKSLFAVVLAALAATASAQLPPPQPMTCDPLPPAGVISAGDRLTAADGIDWTLYSSRNDTTVTVRQVTGGIVVNWIGDPPAWAMAPRVDAFYAWEAGYAAYCRHFSVGVDKTAQTGCRTDCVVWWSGGFYYAVARFSGEWRVVVAEKMGAGVE